MMGLPFRLFSLPFSGKFSSVSSFLRHFLTSTLYPVLTKVEGDYLLLHLPSHSFLCSVAKGLMTLSPDNLLLAIVACKEIHKRRQISKSNRFFYCYFSSFELLSSSSCFLECSFEFFRESPWCTIGHDNPRAIKIRMIAGNNWLRYHSDCIAYWSNH